MKLNMWMIANRLSALEPELHVPESAPANLQSARRAYATQCVYVYQNGGDVVCDGGEEGGYVIFREMECDQVFEMVQFTFDFYREWQEMVIEAAEQLNYEKIVDKSWTVFHNPMMLLDASNNVLAMSEQYGEDEVNNDWRFLCRHGHSSVEVIQYLMEEGRKHEYYMSGSAKIYSFDGKDINANMMSAAIYYKNEYCGRVNVVEKDRPLNPGDILLLDYVIKYLSVVLGRLNQQNINERMLYPVFTKMMLNQAVTSSEFLYWKEYTHWTEDDIMRIVVLSFGDKEENVHDVISICNLLQSNIRNCIAAYVEKDIAFSFKYSWGGEQEIWKAVTEIVRRFSLKAGVSLPVRGIENLHYFYKQALSAIRFGEMFDTESSIYDFYYYAMDFMIAADSMEEAAYACQLDIKSMWVTEELNGGEKVDTLRAYLNNERSLIKTADELFLHRNTLVYRIKKIKDALKYNIDEAYTRDYMKMSIRVLRLYNTENRI